MLFVVLTVFGAAQLHGFCKLFRLNNSDMKIITFVVVKATGFLVVAVFEPNPKF